jgi:hypothetical protein
VARLQFQQSRRTMVTLIPPSQAFISPDAPGGSSSIGDNHPGIPCDGGDKGGEDPERPYEATPEQGGQEQQPPAVPGPSSSSQPVSPPPNSALKSSGIGAERDTEVSGHYPTICANPPSP